MLRQKNIKEGMIWLAVYDEDILGSNLKQKIAYCKDNLLPQQFMNYSMQEMEVYLSSKRTVFVRRSEGSVALCRMYLMSKDQAFDIARFKNYKIEVAKL
jgi:CMP-N-acetylneuraminic acid synthetase